MPGGHEAQVAALPAGGGEITWPPTTSNPRPALRRYRLLILATNCASASGRRIAPAGYTARRSRRRSPGTARPVGFDHHSRPSPAPCCPATTPRRRPGPRRRTARHRRARRRATSRRPPHRDVHEDRADQDEVDRHRAGDKGGGVQVPGRSTAATAAARSPRPGAAHTSARKTVALIVLISR